MRKWLALAGLFAVSPDFSPAWGQARLLPDGPAKHTVETACVSCHALTQVTGAGHSPEEWEIVVHRMVDAGAQVPPDQVSAVIDYLAKNFPPKTLPP
jgi:hypothetical protein